MGRLYVNAPTQNREYDVDRSFGGVIPIFAADWLADSRGDGSSSARRVDLWNSNLAFEGTSGISQGEYRIMMAGRLAAKYSSELLSYSSSTERYSDIDKEFCDWGEQRMARAIDRGTVQIEDRKVHVCKQCGSSLALAEAPLTNGCVVCHSAEHVSVVSKKSLVMKVDAGQQQHTFRMAGIRDRVPANSDADRIYAINKQRPAGVPLDRFGFSGEVLDPKVAIGLLALYVAEKYSADEVHMTVGLSSAHHNIGHLLGFLGDDYCKTTAELVLHPVARAPVGYLNHLRDTGLITKSHLNGFIRKGLPQRLLRRKRPMSPMEAEQAIFSRKHCRY